MTDYVLSTPQLAVICALSSGATTLQAAEQAGIHRNTIATWRRNVLPFQYALADAQYDRALLYREKAEALAVLAIQTIQAILTDPSASAATRLKAALAILQTASTPPEPKKQIILEIQKVKVVDPQPPTSDPIPHATAQNLPNSAQPEIAVDPPSCAAAHSSDPIPHATSQNLPNSAQPEIAVDPSSSAAHAPHPEIVHNSAQSPQPIRRDTSKIGRNDPCPCGSGAKYKRCCLRKPVQPLVAAA